MNPNMLSSLNSLNLVSNERLLEFFSEQETKGNRENFNNGIIVNTQVDKLSTMPFVLLNCTVSYLNLKDKFNLLKISKKFNRNLTNIIYKNISLPARIIIDNVQGIRKLAELIKLNSSHQSLCIKCKLINEQDVTNIIKILTCSKSLQKFSSNIYTEEILNAVAIHCPQLISIDLDCWEFNISTIRNLVSKCPSLKNVRFLRNSYDLGPKWRSKYDLMDYYRISG